MSRFLFFLVFTVLTQVSCVKEEAPPGALNVRFQFDIYDRENSCGKSLKSTHRVLSLSFKGPKKFLRTGTTFVFQDGVSNAEQRVIYKNKAFFYPGLFKPEGHSEFGEPVCEGEECEYFLFIFADALRNLKGELLPKLSVFETEASKKPLAVFAAHKMENTLMKVREAEVLPQIVLTYDKNKKLATMAIPVAWVEKYNSKIEKMDIDFQWRGDRDQRGYNVESEVIQPLTSLKIKKEGFYLITKKIVDPTYLGAFLMFTLDGFVLETKKEIINVKDSFFNCSDSKSQPQGEP